MATFHAARTYAQIIEAVVRWKFAGDVMPECADVEGVTYRDITGLDVEVNDRVRASDGQFVRVPDNTGDFDFDGEKFVLNMTRSAARIAAAKDDADRAALKQVNALRVLLNKSPADIDQWAVDNLGNLSTPQQRQNAVDALVLLVKGLSILGREIFRA